MKTRFLLFLTAFFALQLSAAEAIHISISNPDTWVGEELRPYIGQTVIFDDPLVICSQPSRYTPEYTISTRRLYTPTNQARPNSNDYKNIVRLNNAGALRIVNLPGYHRCGVRIDSLVARVNSTSSLTWVDGRFRGNTREELQAGIPDVGNYDLLVCTYNVENYFMSQPHHDRQCKKIVNALLRIDADIYGLVEMEEGNKGIGEITSKLNARQSKRQYAYCDNGTTASNQTAAFVYDSKTVKPIGVVQGKKGGSIPTTRHRMICFEELATHERFILSVNHFKAKSGSGAAGGDADQGDGQGMYNASRVAETHAVMDLYRLYSVQIKEKDVLIMGDLNAYGKEDPIITFQENGMIDLHRAFHADSSYSYQYGGTAGYLDHALTNSTMRAQVTGMSAFHINSDESDNYTYDKSSDTTMFRGSDHDPVLVGLKLDSTLTYDPSPQINALEVLKGESRVLTILHALKDTQNSYYSIFDISGRAITTHRKIEMDTQPVEMPTAPGIYILYIYCDQTVYPYKFIVR